MSDEPTTHDEILIGTVTNPPDLCAHLFTNESLRVIDGGSGDAVCNLVGTEIRIKLGSKNTLEGGSRIGFKIGNGIVAEGGTAEAATTLFRLRAAKGSKKNRGGRGLSFSMKMPQQVGTKTWAGYRVTMPTVETTVATD